MGPKELIPVWWMIGLSLVSAVVASAVVDNGRSVWLGMLAPLVVASVSWVVMERVYKLNPQRLNSVMMSAFAAKLVFFGAYVALALTAFGVRPVPFVISLTGYFIALHLVEAILLKRLLLS
jgi:hypothetical protein